MLLNMHRRHKVDISRFFMVFPAKPEKYVKSYHCSHQDLNKKQDYSSSHFSPFSYYLYTYDKMVAPNVSLQRETEVCPEVLATLLKHHYSRRVLEHDEPPIGQYWQETHTCCVGIVNIYACVLCWKGCFYLDTIWLCKLAKLFGLHILGTFWRLGESTARQMCYYVFWNLTICYICTNSNMKLFLWPL